MDEPTPNARGWAAGVRAEATGQEIARHVRRLDETRRLRPRAAGTFTLAQAHREEAVTRLEVVSWCIASFVFGFAVAAFVWAP